MRSWIAVALLGLCSLAHASGVEGRWQTLDLETGQARGEVTLKWVNGQLEGYITGGKPRAGESPASICTKCEGALKNQKLLGMRIVWGMQAQEDGSVSGGRILDPDSGNIYRAKLTPSADGNQLAVRGYVGLPAFGKTTTWTRRPPDASPVIP